MSIQEAINEVRTAIVGSTDFDVAVAQAASDYELHPELVKRKFFERYQSVEAVLQVAAHAYDRPRRVQAALEKATAKYGYYGCPEYIGLEVQIDGRNYIFVNNEVRSYQHTKWIMLDSATLEVVFLWGHFINLISAAFNEVMEPYRRAGYYGPRA